MSKQQQDNDDNDYGLSYLTGFGNDLESSCLEGALPVGRNNPRTVPHGLYTEQLSGTAFTKPRALNRRTWLYRIQPSVAAGATAAPVLKKEENDAPVFFGHDSPEQCQPTVTAIRWHPKPTSSSTLGNNFVEGCHLQCHGGGSPAHKNGLAIYVYEFTQNMLTETTQKQCMYNADGEFLLVPQQGTLEVITELGKLRVEPQEIVVIPRGIVFSVNHVNNDNDNTPATGYVLEVYGGDGFQLPELGPIGSNGLANARDFLHPVAHCPHTNPTDYQQDHDILIKMQSRLFSKRATHSPYNVVAWHGNYLPYKYDLRRFCAVNSVTYDHLDPSIYTVLTCPGGMPGTALCDFVLFPPRCMATDSNTLRPPWFHRNTMSEYMGLICGQYDAKAAGSSSTSGGFRPGGASLHNCMTPHGPDQQAFEKAVADPCETPVYFDKGMAFMFETYLPLTVAPASLDYQEKDYAETSWSGLSADHFTAWQALAGTAANTAAAAAAGGSQ